MTVEVRIDETALRRAVTRMASQAATRAAGRTRDYAKAGVTAAGRVDTGAMRNGIVAGQPRVEANQVSVDVISTAQHSRAQHDGTGIYGPTGRPIVPRRARVLRFKPKGATGFVFARQVAGVKPVPFMADALAKITTADFSP